MTKPVLRLALLLFLSIMTLTVSSQLIENYVKANNDHRIATLQNGYVARVWSYTNDTAAGIDQIWIQSFDQDNQPQSSRILIDDYNVKEPALAVLSTGDVIVSYTAYDTGSDGRDGDQWGVMVCKCAPDLSSCGAAIAANTDETVGSQQESEIAVFNNGDFVIGWFSLYTLRAQMFDSGLSPIGSEELVTIPEIYHLRVCIPNDQTMVFVYERRDAYEHEIIRFDKTWSQVGTIKKLPGITRSHEYHCNGRADGMVAVTRIANSDDDNLYTTIYDGLNNEISDTRLNNMAGPQMESFALVLQDNSAAVVFRNQVGAFWESYVHYVDEDFFNPVPSKKISRGQALEDHGYKIQLAQFGTGKIGISYSSYTGGEYYLAIGNICRFNSECDPYVTPACGGLTCDPCTVDSECDADPLVPYCDTIAGICSDEELSISVLSSMEDICQTGEVEIEVATNFTNPDFAVTVVSSIADTVNEANINAHLVGFTTPGTATIPSEYFQADATYTFTVVSKRTEEAVLVMVPEELFKFSSSTIMLNEDYDQALNSAFTLLNCIKAAAITDDWEQIEGPSFSIASYVTESVVNDTHTDIDLAIPECFLTPSTVYNFVYEFSIDAYPDVIAQINITIVTPKLQIDAQIDSLTSIKSKDALDLVAIADHNCPSITNNDLEFRWKCEKQGAEGGEIFADCQDPDSIFGTYQAGQNSLQIPSNYYGPEEILSLVLTVRHLEDTTRSSEVLINVTSYLDISLQTPEVRRCSIRLILDYDQIEQQYSNVFLWELLSTHSETGKMEDLKDFMASILVPSIVIPHEFIEIGAEYSIQASYINFKGNQISQIIDLDPVPEIPYVTFDGSDTQIINSHASNTIKAQTECFPEGLSEEWRFESGPESFDVEEYVSEHLTKWVQIPKCFLIPDSTYRISYTISSDSTSAETISEIELQVNSQTIFLQIDGADSYHPENEDLDLIVQLLTPGNCDVLDQEDFTYEWTCSKFDNSQGTVDPCQDDDNIFVPPYDTNEFKIPKSYFEKDENLRLEVTVQNGLDEVSSSISLIEITDSNIFKLKMSCESEFDCLYFSPQINYFFEVNITNREEGFQGLRAYFSLSPSFSLTEFVNQLKTSQYPAPYYQEESTQPLLSVSFLASNDTHKSIVGKLIPINFSPEGGDVAVTPQQGTLMQTQFVVETQGWTDPDLPLDYKYFVADVEEDSGSEEEDNIIFRPLTQYIKSSTIATLLSTTKLDKSLANLQIKVVVRDAYGASNHATTECGLYIIELSMEDEMALVQSQLSMISQQTDPIEKSKQIAVVANHIYNLEEKIVSEGTQQQCSCSNRGACIEGICSCSEGYTLSECQLSGNELDSFLDTKLSILESMESNLELLSSNNQSSELSYLALEELSVNVEFNTDASINKTKVLMDQLISKDEEDVIITVESAKYVSSILDNILSYQVENDCSATSKMTESIKNDLEAYVNKISEGLRSGKIANEDPEAVVENTFSAQSQIVTECSIEDVEIVIDENAPEISFESDLDEPDCLRNLDLDYFAFQDNMFACGTNGSLLDGTKDIVMLSITDSVTGENVTSDYEVYVSRSWNDTCFEGCSKIQGKQQKCLCGQESSLFDIKGQISSLFEQTNFNKIFNINIDEWKVYDSAMFWLFFVMSLLTAGSFVLIKKKLMGYCFVERAQHREDLKGHHIFFSVFLLNHSLLNCFMIKSMKPGKLARLAVFYTRLMVMMLVVSALGSSSGLSFGRRRQLQDVSLSLDLYILLVPYFTFVPVELILTKLLIVGQKSKDPAMEPRKRQIFKVIKIFAYILMVLITIFSIFAIISIGESVSTEENLETAGIFGRTLAQDWIVTPLIFMILMALVQDDQINTLVAKHKKQEQQTQRQKTKMSQITPLSQISEQPDIIKSAKDNFVSKGQIPTNLDTENSIGKTSKECQRKEMALEQKNIEDKNSPMPLDTEQGLLTPSENQEPLETQKSLLPRESIDVVDLDDKVEEKQKDTPENIKDKIKENLHSEKLDEKRSEGGDYSGERKIKMSLKTLGHL